MTDRKRHDGPVWSGGAPREPQLVPVHPWPFARDTGQAVSYRLFDFTPQEFEPRVRDFFTLGGRGLNVTVPHKVAAVTIASQLTTRATHAGAVNTLAMQKDGAILGDNTDGAGLVRDLCDNLGLVIIRRRILIIGAGGATRESWHPCWLSSPPKSSLPTERPNAQKTWHGIHPSWFRARSRIPRRRPVDRSTSSSMPRPQV